jgi:hypothetical protein
MAVTARSGLARFDAVDVEKVGSFYGELAGWDVVGKDGERFGVPTPEAFRLYADGQRCGVFADPAGHRLGPSR